jgi:hypothetical protein
MSETITIEVSDEDVALEVAYGILGRAQDIDGNPDKKFEPTALELREVGQELAAEYGDDWR